MKRKELVKYIEGNLDIDKTPIFNNADISIKDLMLWLVKIKAKGATDLIFRADVDRHGSTDNIDICPVMLYLESEDDCKKREDLEAKQKANRDRDTEEKQRIEYLRLKELYENK